MFESYVVVADIGEGGPLLQFEGKLQSPAPNGEEEDAEVTKLILKL